MKTLAVLLAATVAVSLSAAQPKITVDLDHPSHKVSPTLWGIFFEDINLSADGGIYPELVRNRSFEDAETSDHWTVTGLGEARPETTIDSSRPLNPFNRKSLRVKLNGGATLENEGYWGMNVIAGESYILKLAARGVEGFNAPLTARLVSPGGKELARAEFPEIGSDWQYHTVELSASAAEPKARLQISASGQGVLFLDMVSLMPHRTWKNHGLRADLGDSLDGMKPAFVRFPGGCWVEGEDMAHMYHWKNTIGDIDVRTPLWNIWGYNATHGLGFHEYLQMCEDLGAAALFCINVGMSHKEVIPMSRMGQWVEDALDAIDYANGPTNTFWGAVRARNGHPAPFNLKYMEIGNENGGAAYYERWPLFYKAIKAKAPEIRLIADVWHGVPKEPKPELIDEHYYNSPEFFMQQAHRYDNYDRNGPRIFVGEYAVTRNAGKGNLRAAIGEAAFMTGMERNSDIVEMASYAPLFVNMNHRKWNPDLINFDSSRWYGLPSYYVQKLFSENRGDETLPTQVETGLVEEIAPKGGIGLGCWNTEAEFKDVKVTAPDGKTLFTSDFSKTSDGWKTLGGGQWQVQDGAFRQTAEREFVRALAGDRSWTDYTVELKARKLAGREGFLVFFHITADDDRTWWNIGGWNNTQHGVELGETLDPKRGQIETGRWYDLRVELKGTSIKCFLDNKLVHDIKNPRLSTRGLYASATRDNKNGELILKVVNGAATVMETQLNFNGSRKCDSTAQCICLTSENPKDENTLDEPTKVAPKLSEITLPAPGSTYSFPGNSLTVLRVKSGN